ncbi:dihydroxyacetone kinase [Pochonia chlamydosporia 170]|uniref:Dihydroxyacetone kinase n=1 Tax=Pochonia chlamydosporia 170 TaxID=1380566 RepID=A0A179FP63_METCM|nr:dihydroxyacetone kinase [Pochonia chlamydosporia 170]OAQ66799.1 dihydroxyacetone kinase [Pochonia chlamydosporia 170]
MSTRHYFPSTAANTLVPRALRALTTANPHLSLDEPHRVIANKNHDPSNVSIIGGGGSGHEPAWSGYVGDGLLSAAACGDIFASPSASQVLAAMEAAPSEQGTILLITNYTGDRLHFGLAAEKARAKAASPSQYGNGKIAIVAATDDVSIGRSKCAKVGRRGLPGHIFTMKTVCSAAAENWSFENCVRVGEAVNAQTVSIGSALDHCHVPGRQHQSVPDDTCVIGAGIHNEPGQRMISPFPSVDDVVKQCLGLLCDMDDPERAFVKFEHEDEIALLVNNNGGISALELGALADEVQSQLAERYDLKPCRTLVGAFETSLNAPGFSISLVNLSAAARECDTAASTLLEFLDRPTTAVSWPNTIRSMINTAKPNPMVNVNGGNEKWSQKGQDLEANMPVDAPRTKRHFLIDASLLDAAVRSACKAAITSEPYLTKWDMVMGDGDCGEAVKDLCEAVLRMLDSGAASSGSLLDILQTLMEIVDAMGGTLGAIFGIFLSAFYSALAKHADQSQPSGQASGMSPIFASSVASAVESLQRHTPAREGDRTVMDVLIPFAMTYAQSNDFVAGVQTAGTKALATRFIKPRLGRASYVGDAAAKEVPDPGAWALYEMLWGIAEGLGMSVTKVTCDDG